MDSSQLLIVGILGLLILLYVRRMIRAAAVTNYSPAEVEEKKRRNEIVLLDVRTANERRQGSIKGSVHIPLHELRRRSDELKKYGNKEIVCYCATGSRSISAAVTLKKLGFPVANMKGGIAEWRFSGLN